MRALVVYESMFGNTHAVALRIGEGLAATFDVAVVPVAEADRERVLAADLLVVGGPTHAHGVSSATSRRSAVDQARKDDGLELDPDAAGPGLREWFEGLPPGDGSRPAAAFDTRVDASAWITGRASKGIAKRLGQHDYRLVSEPESFLVDRHNRLLGPESDRAVEWGRELAGIVAMS